MQSVGKPYRKRISRSVIGGMIDKSFSHKGKGKLNAGKLQKIFDDPSIKGNKHYDRIARSILDQKKGRGRRDIGVDTWRGKAFIKKTQEIVEKGKKEGKFKNISSTRFGKKAASNPKAYFQKHVIEEQIKKEEPEGPSEEQLIGEKRRKVAMQNLHRYQRAKEIEKEQGRFILHDEKSEKEKENKDVQAKSSSDRTPSLSYGSPIIENTQEKRDFGVSASGLNKGESPEKKESKTPLNQPSKTSEKETFKEPPDEGLFE